MKVFLSSLSLLFGLSLSLSEFAKKNVRSNFGENRLIKLRKEHVDSSLFELLEGHFVDDFGHSQGEVHFALSPSAVEVLQSEGYSFSDATEEFLEEMERNLNSEGFVCEDSAESCATKVPEEFYASYQKIDSIHERFNRFARAYPEVTKFETLGTTFEGNEQKVLWIGDQSLPLVFYTCAIHAREWLTPMFCTHVAETLLDTSNEVSKSLLKTFSFAINPVANPDGYIYSHEVDSNWRKTRTPNVNSTCVGTDPNRNYATGWGGPGTSTDPCSNVFHGYEPFDQPCVANIRAFTDEHQERLIHINDVHSYGEYWLSPYAGTTDPPKAEDFDKHNTCNQMVFDAIFETSGLQFKVGPASTTIYVASGGSIDYFYEENKVVHSYVYEARGPGFQPSTDNIVESNKELYAGFLAVLECIEELDLGPIVSENEIPEEGGEKEESRLFSETGAAALVMGSLIGTLVLIAFVSFKLSKKKVFDAEGNTVVDV